MVFPISYIIIQYVFLSLIYCIWLGIGTKYESKLMETAKRLEVLNYSLQVHGVVCWNLQTKTNRFCPGKNLLISQSFWNNFNLIKRPLLRNKQPNLENNPNGTLAGLYLFRLPMLRPILGTTNLTLL